MAKNSGVLASVSLLEPTGVVMASAGTPISLLHAAFKLGEGGTERLSYLYLTGYRNRLVKLRLTYDSLDQEQIQQHLTMFLRELAEILFDNSPPANNTGRQTQRWCMHVI